MEVLAVFMVFLTASLLSVALLWQQEDNVSLRVRSLARRRGQTNSELSTPFADRVILPAVTGLARFASAILPPHLLEDLKRKLAMSGDRMTLNAFLFQAGLFAVLPPSVLLILFLTAGGVFGPTQLLILAVSAIGGALIPYLLLFLRIRKRQKTIWKSLPDAFDLILTSVEAGLGLDAALGRVAEKIPGPFAQELEVTLREVVMGRPRRDALMELGTRSGVADLSSFVNAVIQAEQMGVSIGQVLRVQADQLRMRRRQRAEQAGRRAAILLIFPIILFNLPALFIVAIGPAAIQLVDALGE